MTPPSLVAEISSSGAPPPETGKPARTRVVARGLEAAFGAATLLAGLALLAAVPGLHFLSLGYLLEAGGRVAASGRLREGLIGLRPAAVAGRIAIGLFLVLLPVRLASSYWHDARLIAPGSEVEARWRLALIGLTLLAFAQIAWAGLRGGRLWHFLWPAPLRLMRSLRGFRAGRLAEAAGRVGEWVLALRLPRYFWLGLRGFAGALIWLAGPVAVLMLAGKIRHDGVAFLANLLGAAGLLGVVLYLPFLQTRFALTGRFGALFEVAEVRRWFCRAPVAFWFALASSLLAAVPLYVLKIELIPQPVAWLPALFFVAFLLPARLLTGWAVHRALARETPRLGLWRWLSRLAALPVAAVYVFFVWITQYLSWQGAWSLLEQHAFLVPAQGMGF